MVEGCRGRRVDQSSHQRGEEGGGGEGRRVEMGKGGVMGASRERRKGGGQEGGGKRGEGGRGGMGNGSTCSGGLTLHV